MGMIKESQEQLIEKLANALNQVDSFQVDIEYYIEEGHASIWFSVKDMDTLDLFCNSVKKELENSQKNTFKQRVINLVPRKKTLICDYFRR